MRKSISKSAAAGFVVAALLAACSHIDSDRIAAPRLESPPPTTPPENSAVGSVDGFVVGEAGVCLSDATVQIVTGPGTGRQMVQKAACDAWAYGNGFSFDSLPFAATVTIRAERVGYQSRDVELAVGVPAFAVIVLLPQGT